MKSSQGKFLRSHCSEKVFEFGPLPSVLFSGRPRNSFTPSNKPRCVPVRSALATAFRKLLRCEIVEQGLVAYRI